MTHQEVKALANGRAIPPWIMKLVSDAIAIEVAREREACAKVCDEQEFDYWRSSEDQEWTPQDCAKALRARSFATSRGEA
jgi:hypothetical protein